MRRITSTFVLLCYYIQAFSQSPELPPDSVSKYYTVENIPLPQGLSGETGGIAFMPDGRLVACFRRGEVMTYQPQTKEWKLFAEGLHDPLGILAVSNSEILVMQRPELSRITDTDGDGQADLYQTITDDFGMTGNYHEFAYGPLLAKDGSYFIALNLGSNGAGIGEELRGRYDSLGRQGRMYSCVPYRGWVMKVSPDGKVTPWASGFRSPNGLGFDREGNLFVSDNQGDWIGTSTLHHVEQGKFYGHPSSLIWKEGFPDVDPTTLPVAQLDQMRTKAAVLFPQGIMADSPTQSICDNTGGKFGPFTGQMLIGEMNYSRIMRLMLEKVEGQIQGACVDLYFGKALRKGNNRLQFAPDGSLWVGQTDHGWAGDQGIQRISWNGKVPMEILQMNVTPQGFDLTFTHAVDKSVATLPDNYQFKRYYYTYHKEYGSKQMDMKPVKVTGVHISPDGKKVSLSLSEMKPGYVYEMQVKGMKSYHQLGLLNHTVYYTLNALKK